MGAVEFHQAVVPEWEAEEMLTGRLAEEVWPADPGQAEEMLNSIRLDLPDQPQHTDLVAFAGERETPLDEKLRADVAAHDFRLIALPIGILVPEDQRLVRLRLRVTLDTADGSGTAAAYDVFPRTEWRSNEHEPATVSIDVGKALVFVLPPLGEALGLKLSLPIRYTTHDALVQSTGPMSNPVDWEVKSQQIRDGFTPYLIVRTSKDAGVTLDTQLACELRRSGAMGRLFRATFRSDRHVYKLPTF